MYATANFEVRVSPQLFAAALVTSSSSWRSAQSGRRAQTCRTPRCPCRRRGAATPPSHWGQLPALGADLSQESRHLFGVRSTEEECEPRSLSPPENVIVGKTHRKMKMLSDFPAHVRIARSSTKFLLCFGGGTYSRPGPAPPAPQAISL